MDAATGSVAFALDAAIDGCYHAKLKRANKVTIVINSKSNFTGFEPVTSSFSGGDLTN